MSTNLKISVKLHCNILNAIAENVIQNYFFELQKPNFCVKTSWNGISKPIVLLFLPTNLSITKNTYLFRFLLKLLKTVT